MESPNTRPALFATLLVPALSLPAPIAHPKPLTSWGLAETLALVDEQQRLVDARRNPRYRLRDD